jgi:O-glycosyl hydrolase
VNTRTGILAAAIGCVITLTTACSVDGRPPAPTSQTSTQSSPAKGPGSSEPPGKLQVISGLGVNANVHSWNNGELRPAIDTISELGELTWRVIIDKADWESAENPDSPETIDEARYSSIYESGKMADLWETVEYINSKPGQQVMINVMGGVPAWMGGNHVDESREEHWVRMVASMVAYGRTVRGLDFTLLGPMNETDWNGIEGPQVGPEQYVRLLHKLIVRLDSLGLSDIRIVGPDTASASKAVETYLPVLAQDALVLSRLAYFGIHSYDGYAAGADDALESTTTTGLDFWVTEFSGPCPGCDSGAPNPTEWASAAATAEQAIDLLQQGAAGLQQYDAWDGYYEHHESMGYWGLLTYDETTGTYSPRKAYFVFRQLTKYTPRNSVRLEATSDQDSVRVVAFHDQATNRVTLFGQNFSDVPVEATLSTPGRTENLQLSSSSTDGERDMQPGEDVDMQHGSVTYVSAPNSIFTLTGITTRG